MPHTETSSLLSLDLADSIIEYVHDHRQHLAKQKSRASTVKDDYVGTLRPQPSIQSCRRPDVLDLISTHSVLSVGQEPQTSIGEESKWIVTCSIPIVITHLLQYSLTVASVFSVGRIGNAELAAVSLASMTANISGYAIVQGVATCLDTLCAQAYGRRNFEAVGIHYVRCTILLLLSAIPVIAFWTWGVYPVLNWGVGDSNLAQLSATYLEILGYGFPGYIIFETTKHYLQAQGIFEASALVLVISATVNAILNYVLVWDSKFGLGFIGAPLAVSLTNYLMCVLLLAYILFINGSQCWPSKPIYNLTYWSNWGKMTSIAFPGVLMVESEWLAFEIITLEAANFGTEVLAAQSIISTTFVLFYQVCFALGITCSTRVAWYVGAASKTAAETSVKAALIVSLVGGSLAGGLMSGARYWFASRYTNNHQVIEIATKVLYWVGPTYQVSDYVVCAMGGILRGQGRQKVGGYVNLVGYYLIGLPCAYWLGFTLDIGVLGLWSGMVFSLVVVSVILTYFVRTSHWDEIINEAVYDGVEEGAVYE